MEITPANLTRDLSAEVVPLGQYLVQLNSLIQDWAIYCMDSADDFDGDRYVSPIESILMDIAHSVGLDWGDVCRLTYDERHKEAKK